MMLKKALTIASAGIILTACGGGGGGGEDNTSNPTSPGVNIGTFVDSPVEGLFYKTETRSGLTNANGEFEYLDGETVEFQIGNISLGVTGATSMVTPFSLSGITPITTEVGIVSALTSSSFSSFDKAINIATLLQALDEDGNPENGIDLADAHEKLDQEEINLYVKATEFEKQSEFFEIRRTLDIGHRRTFGQAVQHMYESLEIDIESAQVNSFSSGQNDANSQTISYEYDNNGLISTENTDLDNDGEVDFAKSFEYDDRGNVIQIQNSATNVIETLTYNTHNKILSRLIDYPNNANDLLESYTYISGKLIRLELDKQADGSPDSITQYQYDLNGNLTYYEIDTDADGTPETRAKYNYINGEISSFEEYRDGDDIADFMVSYGLDDSGNRVSHDIDLSEGSLNSVGEFVYDANQRVVRYERYNKDNMLAYVEDYRYDNQGNRTQVRRDTNADGDWDKIAQYSYDINNNRTQMIEDNDGNGVVDKVWEGNYEAAVLDNSWESILSKL